MGFPLLARNDDVIELGISFRRGRAWTWVAAFLAGGAVLLAALIGLVRHEEHVAQGEEITYDDFGFSVLEHRTEERLGDVAAQGVFHVVRLEVRNHAKRVDYRLDQHRPVLVDERGERHEVAPEAQRVLDSRAAAPRLVAIGPGQSFSCELAFDVPKERTNLRLQISWGGSWIDLLDWVFSGGRDIALR